MFNFAQSYFQDGNLKLRIPREREIRTEVPQDSVLGPLLWIFFFDELLRLKIPGLTLITFASDLADTEYLLGNKRDKIIILYTAKNALNRVVRGMEERKLEFVYQKTKGLILSGPS